MKNKLFLPIIICAIFSTSTLFAQQERKCAANDVMEKQIAQNPSFAANQIAIEKQTQEYVASKRQNNINGKKPDNPGGGGGGNPPPPPPPPSTFSEVTIPVVVHILYNTSDQNIAAARIAEQIKILNDDFANTNSDNTSYIPSEYSLAVSQGTGIKFCLVQTIRKSTSVTAFNTNDAMKYTSSGGSDAVDPTKFLNIWVCNMSGGILGYAQFPGGNSATDGIVIQYDAFGNTTGPYNMGRTATHEVGHYFNLRHIWGDRRCGNDYVDDTPLHDAANYGCPGQGATSNCKGPVVEMWMNYMDYTYDKCMYMFSKDQALRMQATLSTGGPRIGMVQATPCSTPVVIGSSRTSDVSILETTNREGTEFKVFPSVSSGRIFLQTYTEVSGISELNIFNVTGALVNKRRLSLAEGVSQLALNLNDLSNGVYFVQLQKGSNKQIQKIIIQH